MSKNLKKEEGKTEEVRDLEVAQEQEPAQIGGFWSLAAKFAAGTVAAGGLIYIAARAFVKQDETHTTLHTKKEKWHDGDSEWSMEETNYSISSYHSSSHYDFYAGTRGNESSLTGDQEQESES